MVKISHWVNTSMTVFWTVVSKGDPLVEWGVEDHRSAAEIAQKM